MLTHEPAEQAGSSLVEHVRPLEVDGDQAHPWERLHLRTERREAVGQGDELDERAAIRVDEGASNRHGALRVTRGGGARVWDGEADAGEEERMR